MAQGVPLLRRCRADEDVDASGECLCVVPHFGGGQRVAECRAELDEAGIGQQCKPSSDVAAGWIELCKEDLAVARPDARHGQSTGGRPARSLHAHPGDQAHDADCRRSVIWLTLAAAATAGASASSIRIDTDVLSLFLLVPSTAKTVAPRTNTAPVGRSAPPIAVAAPPVSWVAGPVATTSTASPSLRWEVGTCPGLSDSPMTTLPFTTVLFLVSSERVINVPGMRGTAAVWPTTLPRSAAAMASRPAPPESDTVERSEARIA